MFHVEITLICTYACIETAAIRNYRADTSESQLQQNPWFGVGAESGGLDENQTFKTCTHMHMIYTSTPHTYLHTHLYISTPNTHTYVHTHTPIYTHTHARTHTHTHTHACMGTHLGQLQELEKVQFLW